jgi:hypothetical protein
MVKSSTVYVCEHCGRKHEAEDIALECEQKCYSSKMSKCEMCKFYRTWEHEKSPPTRFMKKLLCYRYLWIEKYCLLMKFYERYTCRKRPVVYWGRQQTPKLSMAKDFRNGKKGLSCCCFEEN